MNRGALPDLRILALAEAKLLPTDIQRTFDTWRILRARDAVVAAVRRRMIDDPMLTLFVERLEAADEDQGVFEGIYALAEIVDLHRSQLGLHSEYLILIMSSHLNPWALLAMNRDFANPAPAAVSAAAELWRLVGTEEVDVGLLLDELHGNELLDALTAYYAEVDQTE